MSTIANVIRASFSGALVVGDTHGDFQKFKAASDYATEHNLFFLSAGDLVDRGDNPYEVVELMHARMQAGTGGFIRGNHDDKFYRYAASAKVSFSRDAKKTLADVGAEREAKFLSMYTEIIDMPVVSDMYHKLDDIAIAHAASHPAMWDSTLKFGSEAKSRALFGEVNGEKDEDGYPVRLYNWVNEVPMGKTIIVGHDRTPVFNKPLYAPLERRNSNGGRAIFIDTGCGKGGFLTGLILSLNHGKFEVSTHVEFK